MIFCLVRAERKTMASILDFKLFRVLVKDRVLKLAKL